MESNKYCGIDLGKFFMAVCVIAIHTNPLKNCSSPILLSIYNQVVGTAVPFFFMASGFFLSRRFTSPFGSGDNAQIVRLSLIRYIRLYLLWTLIYLPLAIIYWASSGLPLRVCVSQYILSFVFVGQHYNSWILWYLLSTIYALAVIGLCLKWGCSRIHLLIVACIAMVLSIGVNRLCEYTGVLLPALNFVRGVLLETIRTGRIFSGLFFIPVGILLWDTRISKKSAFCFFLLSFILSPFPMPALLRTLIHTLGNVALFAGVKEIRLPSHPVYPILRKVSTGMYFIHLYVWTFYYSLVYHQKTYGPDCFIATVLISFLLSLLYALKWRKTASARTW